MIHTSLQSLCNALFDLPLEEVKEAKGKALSDLCNVYFDALHNPPDGIIGVGAIAYAESVLIDCQLGEEPEGIKLSGFLALAGSLFKD